MKKAIVTRSDNNIKKMADITHPLIQCYCDKCDADFIIYDHEPIIWTKDTKPHYRIVKALDTFKDYNRILFIDSDTIINKNCPNIFEEVPYTSIGSIFEDKGSRFSNRRKKINNIQRVWGDVGWKEGYTNAGVFIASDIHKDIFKSFKGKYWLEWGSADLHMSYMARKNNFTFHELSFKWNHMTMFSEPWNNNADRFDSYIIHYGGKGVFEKNKHKDRVSQIKSDYQFIYQ